jgi:carboxymethylenebutenolidase
MKTRKYLSMAVALVAGMLMADGAFAAAAKINEATVQFESVGAKLNLLTFKSGAAGKQPAVLLIHDKDGVTDDMKTIARTIAGAGYNVFLPDYPSRPNQAKVQGPMDQMAGISTKVKRLNVAATLADTMAAFEAATKDPSVDAAKVSVMGIGWGGWRAYQLAANNPAVYKTVVVYGVAPDDGSLANIKSPVLGLYAAGDFYITATHLTTKQELGNKFTYEIYKDTYPGFFGGGEAGVASTATLVGEGEIDTAAAAKEAALSKVVDKGPESRKLAMAKALAFMK